MGQQRGDVTKNAQELEAHSSSDEESQSHNVGQEEFVESQNVAGSIANNPSSDEEAQSHDVGQEEFVESQNVAGSIANNPSTSIGTDGESAAVDSHLERNPGPSSGNVLGTHGVAEASATEPDETEGTGIKRGDKPNDRSIAISLRREAATPGDGAPPAKIQKMESTGGSRNMGNITIREHPMRTTQDWQRMFLSWQRMLLSWQRMLISCQRNQDTIPVYVEIQPRNEQRGVHQQVGGRDLIGGNNHGNPLAPSQNSAQLDPQESDRVVDFNIDSFDPEPEIINEFKDRDANEEENDDE